MFNITDMDLPVRSRKDLARAQQMRGLARRRGGPSLNVFDNMFGGMNRDMLQRNFQQGPLGVRDQLGRDALIRDRFDKLADSPSGSSRSISRSQSGGSPVFDYPSDYAAASRMPSETAANNLLHALTYALTYCQDFERDWGFDTKFIVHYATNEIIEELWARRIDWNGLGLTPVTPTAPNVKPPKTFEEMRLKLRKAFSDIRNASVPRPRGPSGASDGPEDVTLMMKKLATSCQGVVELLEAVRKYRSRMGPLIKELLFIEGLLKDHEGIWARPVGRESEYEAERFESDPWDRR